MGVLLGKTHGTPIRAWAILFILPDPASVNRESQDTVVVGAFVLIATSAAPERG